MAINVDFDGTAKLIIVKNGVTSLDVRKDLYSAWKHWVLDGNANFQQALRVVGGDPITGSLSVSGYFFLTNGWRIRPYEGDHRLELDGNLFVEEGGAPTVETIGDYRVEVALILTANAQTVTVENTDLNAVKRNTDLIPGLL